MATYPTTTDCCAPLEKCEVTYNDTLYCGPTFGICEDYCTCDCTDKARPKPEQTFCSTCLDSKACIDLEISDDDDLVTDGGIMGMLLSTLAIKGRSVPNEEDIEACVEPLTDCNDYGGWWHDSFSGNSSGTRVWTLEGRDLSNSDGSDAGPQLQLEAEQIIREDLQFMIDNGWVRKFDITSSVDECGTLCIEHLDVYPPKGEDRLKAEVSCLWPKTIA